MLPIKKIYIEDFDPTQHDTEFKDYVLALDKTTRKTCRIPKNIFDANPNFVGITKGRVVAYDTVANKRVTVTQDEFDNSKNPEKSISLI
jgi:hypothetical protein